MKQTPSRFGILVTALLVASTLASCTSKINDEQKAKLRDLRQLEQTLTQQLKAKEDERMRVQSEITSRKAELDKCNANKKFVQDKLQQWPNVWPK